MEAGRIARGSDVFHLFVLALLMRDSSLIDGVFCDPVVRHDAVAVLGRLREDPVIRRLGPGRR